jgi:MFS family permease
MPELDTAALDGRRRKWLIAASVGCALVALAMITVALVIADKPHFGWLVGSMFLPAITSGVLLGAIILLIAAWNLPERKRWQGLTLMAWALIALASPAFGIMFLLPWGVLALSLPLVIASLILLFRQGVPRSAQMT